MVWGLAYKPGTSTLRRSLSVELCEWLFDEGSFVYVHDPAVYEPPEEWDKHQFKFIDDPLDPLSEIDALVVGTQWPQYLELEVDPHHTNKNLIVFDPGRYLGEAKFEDSVEYISVGTLGR